MKKMICSFLSFLCIFSLFCYDNIYLVSVASAGTVNALVSVEEICSGLSKNPNIVGDFTQIKTIKSNGRKLKSTGKFIICNEGIVWETKKPFSSCVIFTEDKMVQVANNGKVSIMDGKDNLMFESISSTMIAVFAGNADKLENNFVINLYNDDSNVENWNLKLVPRDKSIKSVMEELILSGSYNKNNVFLNSLEMHESSGNTIQYIFANQSYPKELSANEKEYFSIK